MIYSDAKEAIRGKMVEIPRFYCYKTALHLIDPDPQFISSGLLQFDPAHAAKLLDILTINSQVVLYAHLMEVLRAYDVFENNGLTYDYAKVTSILGKGADDRITQVCRQIDKHAVQGVIKPYYDLCGTITGRPVSKGFPFLSLDNNEEIRSIFKAKPGYTYCYMDWKQAQLRLAAYIFRDEQFIRMCESVDDLYLEFGGRWKLDRKQAKEAILASIFGATAQGVAQRAGVEIGDAMAIQSVLFNEFPGIRDWIGYVRYASGNEWVWSCFSRRRRVSSASNEAVLNFPIQSAEADMKYCAVRGIHDFGYSKFLALDMHDGLIFQIPVADYNEVASNLKAIMEHPPIKAYLPGTILADREVKMPVSITTSNSLWFKQ